MKEIVFRPNLYEFDTFKEFLADFPINKNDLILTNRYILKNCDLQLLSNANFVFQEDFGTGEPTDEIVDAIIREIKSVSFDRIIAIGGGSILDIGKVLSISNGMNCDSLYNTIPFLKKTKELILIPTTCGTGSEMTNIAIINRLQLNTKVGLCGDSMYADFAILIPEFLNQLPFGVFATSSMDAFIHASESFLSPNATDYSRLFSLKALDLILTAYTAINHSGKTTFTILKQCLLASNYAGLAFGTAGCAAVHALGYPLSATHHVPHGESCYAVFNGVLKKYEEKSPSTEAMISFKQELSTILGCPQCDVYSKLEDLLNSIIPHKRLEDYGVHREELPEFAKNVIDKQQRLLKNNCTNLSYKDILDIYLKLL